MTASKKKISKIFNLVVVNPPLSEKEQSGSKKRKTPDLTKSIEKKSRAPKTGQTSERKKLRVPKVGEPTDKKPHKITRVLEEISEDGGTIQQGNIAQFMRKRTQLVGFEYGQFKHMQYLAEFVDNSLDAIESFQWREQEKSDPQWAFSLDQDINLENMDFGQGQAGEVQGGLSSDMADAFEFTNGGGSGSKATPKKTEEEDFVPEEEGEGTSTEEGEAIEGGSDGNESGNGETAAGATEGSITSQE